MYIHAAIAGSINYCINAVCHGGHQPGALLRCYGCVYSGHQLICIVVCGFTHLLLNNRWGLGQASLLANLA